jgi:hypothetical protein
VELNIDVEDTLNVDMFFEPRYPPRCFTSLAFTGSMFRLAHAHSSLLEAINAIDVEADLNRQVFCCHCKPAMVVMVIMIVIVVIVAMAITVVTVVMAKPFLMPGCCLAFLRTLELTCPC